MFLATHSTALVATLALAACGVAGTMSIPAEGRAHPAATLASADGAGCILDARRFGATTEIEARYTAGAATRGTYTLRIESAGGQIAQSGDFEAAAGQTVVLSTSALAGAGALSGRLEVTTPAGRVTCPVAAPLGRL